MLTFTSTLVILDITKSSSNTVNYPAILAARPRVLITILLFIQQLLEGDVVNNSADGLDILLQPSGAPAFLPVSHLSDHLINCKALLSVYTPSTKLKNVVYYGRSKDKSMVSLYICAKLLAL